MCVIQAHRDILMDLHLQFAGLSEAFGGLWEVRHALWLTSCPVAAKGGESKDEGQEVASDSSSVIGPTG